MRPLKGVGWALYVAVSYLIFAEAVQAWIRLPTAGNILFTLVFVLFSVLHCAAMQGWRRTAVFFLASALVTYTMEEIGVRTGWVFGAYHYSDLLGPKLGHVPVLIPLGWFMMIYPSWIVARVLLQGANTRRWPGVVLQAAVAAVTMTAWDVVMDPGMSTGGANWVWEHGGAYFGVPRHNYGGWLATTFLVYLIAGWLWRAADRSDAEKLWFPALPVLVYALFAARYVASNHYVALQMVAIFAMGLPALLAVARVVLGHDGSAPRDGRAS